jgi:heme-degrading monooxygenase HmoA
MAQVTFINLFEVSDDREKEFLAAWNEVSEYLRAKPGYVRHRLHRALEPDRRFRFVNTAVWESEQHFRAGHDEGFYALVGKPVWKQFPFFPGVFEVYAEGGK